MYISVTATNRRQLKRYLVSIIVFSSVELHMARRFLRSAQLRLEMDTEAFRVEIPLGSHSSPTAAGEIMHHISWKPELSHLSYKPYQ